MAKKWKKIGELLLEEGAIAPAQINYVLKRMAVTGERFGETGVGEGLFDEDVLARMLARQFDLDYIDLAGYAPDPELKNVLPASLPDRWGVVPVTRLSEGIVVAIADPTDAATLDRLELLAQDPLILRVAARAKIRKLVEGSEVTSNTALKEVSEDLKLQLVKETERGEEILSLEKLTADTSPIIRLIDSTLYDAINKRASDIHIENSQEGVLIKYRVDGVLYRATEPLPSHFQSPVISRIKVMSELDISERRIPQDGRFKVLVGGRSIDFRVSILPSSFGEDAVIRILDKESIAADLKGLSLEALGFNEREKRRFRRVIREPYGMVLVTGPTGSGKTTTLYAALSEIYNEQEKIITIEDPVEYQVRGVVQVPVNEKKGLTFARGLRSILRHDPDKIMVGEIRDPETAQISVQSALTGHLVFTTVHANNVFDVLGRFLHMGLDPYNFVSCLNCVAAQRLVRKICSGCKAPMKYEDHDLREAGLDPDRFRETTFYAGTGCSQCHGLGYFGRVAILELLDLNDEIRELIINKAPMSRLRDAAARAGTVFLREAALEKVFSGVTTLEEINRVTFVEQAEEL
jgi:type II secretory ATPase GspE/PulE/Tfp pilus assembly ATPase PilB-like protein